MNIFESRMELLKLKLVWSFNIVLTFIVGFIFLAYPTGFVGTLNGFVALIMYGSIIWVLPVIQEIEKSLTLTEELKRALAENILI